MASVFYYVVGGHSPDFMTKNGATYRFVKDHLGSPRLVLDTSTGTSISCAARIASAIWRSAAV